MSSVLFIYRVQNPSSLEWTEHKLKTETRGLYDNVTHLYTLILRRDDTFTIMVDNNVTDTGSLHDSALFTPPFEPPRMIADPTDIKPKDWVDEAQLPDPTDKKPADWDEDAPEMLKDTTAEKPKD